MGTIIYYSFFIKNNTLRIDVTNMFMEYSIRIHSINFVYESKVLLRRLALITDLIQHINIFILIKREVRYIRPR